jgi:hypothetical protein
MIACPSWVVMKVKGSAPLTPTLSQRERESLIGIPATIIASPLSLWERGWG